MALYSKQFKWQDDLIHNIGLSFYKKDWVVKEIVYHPLKFAKERMEDLEDERPIRIRYFGSFMTKKVKTKERVERYKYIYSNYELFKDVVGSHGYKVDTLLDFQKSMKNIGQKNMWLIDKLYKKSSVVDECPAEVKQNDE